MLPRPVSLAGLEGIVKFVILFGGGSTERAFGIGLENSGRHRPRRRIDRYNQRQIHVFVAAIAPRYRKTTRNGAPMTLEIPLECRALAR